MYARTRDESFLNFSEMSCLDTSYGLSRNSRSTFRDLLGGGSDDDILKIRLLEARTLISRTICVADGQSYAFKL